MKKVHPIISLSLFLLYNSPLFNKTRGVTTCKKATVKKKKVKTLKLHLS